jgi:hypothetical protein
MIAKTAPDFWIEQSPASRLANARHAVYDALSTNGRLDAILNPLPSSFDLARLACHSSFVTRIDRIAIDDVAPAESRAFIAAHFRRDIYWIDLLPLLAECATVGDLINALAKEGW